MISCQKCAKIQMHKWHSSSLGCKTLFKSHNSDLGLKNKNFTKNPQRNCMQQSPPGQYSSPADDITVAFASNDRTQP